MSTLKRNVNLTPEEYIEAEQYGPIRHELVGGRLYAMVGASRAHNLIAGNLHAALHAHLAGKNCQVFISDMKVRVGEDFYYPDVVVECDASDPDPYYCREPRLIVEVLFASTEKWDMITKRVAYQSLSSLQEYVVVAQDRREMQVYRRAGDTWDVETYAQGDAVWVASVGLSLPMAAVYEGA
jgi:Uma2 family endonuclease